MITYFPLSARAGNLRRRSGNLTVHFFAVPDLYHFTDCRGYAGKMLTIGVFSHIALQVILNLLVVTGLFPTTGVTLPFFSYGGSASVFLLWRSGWC